MKKCNARGSAARDPHGIKQITVGPPHGIKQITMFIRENVECLDSSFTTTTTIKSVSHTATSEHPGLVFLKEPCLYARHVLKCAAILSSFNHYLPLLDLQYTHSICPFDTSCTPQREDLIEISCCSTSLDGNNVIDGPAGQRTWM
ncbi:hypothetical protein J6590_034395 [Homalodisca vitripennis]|nr:hypothetical protein J6590_034395 [Homalodisca vitripennis]